MRVSNNKARDKVNGLYEFQGSNTFAEWLSSGHHESKKLYVVYSYGHHFPMYVYDDQEDKWVGNKDKYSQSTSRHQSQCKPSGDIHLWLDTEEIREVINNHGLVGYLINKAQN